MLILPHTPLNRTGTAVVPAPWVVIPVEALAVLAIVGLVLLVITVFAASRTANRMAIADVLRTGTTDARVLRLQLRRLRSEALPGLTLAGLVFVTTLLLAVGPRMLERISNRSLAGELGAAPAAQRDIVITELSRPTGDVPRTAPTRRPDSTCCPSSFRLS